MIGEEPSVYESVFPVARKEYICVECNRAIAIGQKYHYAKGCWNGKWEKYRTCISCHDLRNELDLYDGIPPFGELEEWAKAAEFEFPIWR